MRWHFQNNTSKNILLLYILWQLLHSILDLSMIDYNTIEKISVCDYLMYIHGVKKKNANKIENLSFLKWRIYQ